MKFTAVLLCTVCLVLNSAAQKTNIPAELKPFVTKGYQVLDFSKADYNADGQPDYILILKKDGEDTISADNDDYETPRPFYLITKSKDNKLQVAVENKSVVMCRNCGGAFGDPYEGLKNIPGGFQLQFYGGAGWRWDDTYIFKYNKAAANWFLDKHTDVSYHAGDPVHTRKTAVFTAAETGPVTLKDFTTEYNSDSTVWKVKAAKTFFYDSPSLTAKPRKGYLLKGNQVQGSKTFAHFVQCYFEEGDKVTEGYILKKDLEKVSAE